MKDLINELEHNKKVNEKNNFENTVDIDYILERLKDVNQELEELLNFFKYHNNNLTRKQDYILYSLEDMIWR